MPSASESNKETSSSYTGERYAARSSGALRSTATEHQCGTIRQHPCLAPVAGHRKLPTTSDEACYGTPRSRFGGPTGGSRNVCSGERPGVTPGRIAPRRARGSCPVKRSTSPTCQTDVWLMGDPAAPMGPEEAPASPTPSSLRTTRTGQRQDSGTNDCVRVWRRLWPLAPPHPPPPRGTPKRLTRGGGGADAGRGRHDPPTHRSRTALADRPTAASTPARRG